MDTYDLTAAWQLVFDGSADNVCLQASGRCLISIGDEPANATTPGIVLSGGVDGTAFLAGGLSDTEIWARSELRNVTLVVGAWG